MNDPLPLARRLDQIGLKACVGLPFIIFFFLCIVYDPAGILTSREWIPSLGVTFSLRLDGLSMLFAGMISLIGGLIQLYALSYMRGHKAQLSFHIYLTLFMFSMLGLVLADNLLMLFVFWELTTITSYLLIGFKHEALISRKNALQAMLITGAGGLALLAGLILMGQMVGTYSITEILANADLIKKHDLFLPALILVLAGAFTKSAQVPFHFWLPGAMAAPTPVSAYLHSATMVKAGIYLLARLSPAFAGTDVWFYTLAIFGGATALWTGILALRQTDLKLMLAYSTNVALGKLVFLLAFGTDYALTAALLFIIAHACYKASLFMVVGNIDHATGTREVEKLGGLKPILFLSFCAAILAAASKAGLPPFFGFLSKEYMYKAGLGIDPLAIAVLLPVNMFMVVLAVLLVLKPFLGTVHTPYKSPDMGENKQNFGLWLPPLFLGAAGIILPVTTLGWLEQGLISPGTQVINPENKALSLSLWHGFNLPLLLSALTLLLGVGLYKILPVLGIGLDRLFEKIPSGTDLYHSCFNALMGFAGACTKFFQHGIMSIYILTSFGTLAVMCLVVIILKAEPMNVPVFEAQFYEWGLAILLVASAIITVQAPSKLIALAALGAIGFLTTLIFMLYAAPDVAKTQLLVETLLVIFMLLIVRHIQLLNTDLQHRRARQFIHVMVAGAAGFSVTVLLLAITALPMDMSISDYFAAESVPGGHGRNIVNVILVDFRAFDTLAEIIVVVVAALAGVSLMHSRKERRL